MTRSPDLNNGNTIKPFPVNRKEDRNGQTDIRKPTIIPQGSPPDRQTPSVRRPTIRPVFSSRQETESVPQGKTTSRGDVGHRSPNPQASKMAPQVKEQKKKMLSKAAARTVNSDVRPPKLRSVKLEKQFEAPAKKSVAATDEKDKSKKSGKLAPLGLLIKDATGLACLILAAVIFGLQLFWPHLPLFNWGLSSSGLTNYVLYKFIYFLLGIFLPIVLFSRIYKIDPTHIMGSGKTNRQNVIQGLLTGLIAAIFLRGVHNVLVYAMTRNGMIIKENITPVYPDLKHPIAVIPVVLFSILLPTILDELLFRGIIQTGLSQGGHPVWGIFGSALIYMLAQEQTVRWVVPLGVALLTARIRYIYDDIKLAMVLNCAIRTMLTVLQIVIPRFDSNHVLLQLTDNKAQFYISLFAVLIGVIVLWFQWSSLEKRAPYGWRPKRITRSQAYIRSVHPLYKQEKKFILRTLPWGYVAAILIMCMGMLLQISE